MVDLSTLTVADFEPHLNTVFQLHYGNGETLEVTLVEARTRGIGTPDHRQGFSLLLQSTINDYLQQGIYHITHEVVEPMDLFIVPVGPNQTGMRYEIIFN